MLTQLAGAWLMRASGERETAIHIACGATPFRALVPFGAWLLKVTAMAGLLGWLALAWWTPQTDWKAAVGIGWGGLLMPVFAGISVAWLRISRIPVSDLLRWS
ncbi:MAG: hypothetical protein C0504_16355 [Candidatus Solibacter sp.]|nr:hypothetical protein [Candidatus Solibacter sp.]